MVEGKKMLQMVEPGEVLVACAILNIRTGQWDWCVCCYGDDFLVLATDSRKQAIAFARGCVKDALDLYRVRIIYPMWW